MTQKNSDTRWASGSSHEAIVTVGQSVLRQRAAEVTCIADARPICEKMVSLLRELNGAGLAAPQIGESVRIIVVEVRKTDFFPDRPESPLFVMLNPVIERFSGPDEDGWEGCFSVPGLMGVVTRPHTIDVRYTTPEGEECIESMSGYVARVVQHECDHLDGIIFLSRMKSMDTLTTVTNYKLLHQKATNTTA